MIDHIARLEGEVRQLTVAATLWQERARVLEGRLLALGAGDAPQDAPRAQPEVPGATEPPRPASEPSMLRWWRWLRRMGDG